MEDKCILMKKKFCFVYSGEFASQLISSFSFYIKEFVYAYRPYIELWLHAESLESTKDA